MKARGVCYNIEGDSKREVFCHDFEGDSKINGVCHDIEVNSERVRFITILRVIARERGLSRY